MRRAARTDGNHAAIASALRRVAIVLDCHGAPEMGCDLLVLTRGRVLFVEVKDGALPPSRRKLTEQEARVQRLCRSAGVPYLVVGSVADALAAVTG